jgi:hypothetical protein
MADSKRGVLNISALLTRCREHATFQPKATFWFGAVLSLVEEHEDKELHDDSSTVEKAELIRLMTSVLAAITGFYEQERPPGVYRLLNFISSLL